MHCFGKDNKYEVIQITDEERIALADFLDRANTQSDYLEITQTEYDAAEALIEVLRNPQLL